jgi:glutamate 5-kinase
LQALSAIGQHRLMRVYDDALGAHSIAVGQVLLAPLDFGERRQYLHARTTLRRLLELGVVPVVNENDAVADDEIRLGDNDRIAALVANLLGASLLVLLTDQPGLFDADPRHRADASLVELVTAIDAELEAVAGGPGTKGGSGGMAAKVAAARMAAWSGVRVVIAKASRPDVVRDAIRGESGVGTIILPSDKALSERKLWIAFALPSSGRMIVDAGAKEALVAHDASLLVAGVVRAEGVFQADDAVEIATEDGEIFAKGITRLDSARQLQWLGKHSGELTGGLSPVAVHRDDLVILSGVAQRHG